MSHDSHPPIRRKSELMPAEEFVLKQLTMLGRLNGLRGMAWAYAVLHFTGLSASTASKKFTPKDHLVLDKNGNAVISNIMYQYINGKRPPTIGPRGKLGFDLVGEIDKDPKGRLATPWLSHVIWDVLHPDLTLQAVRNVLYSMPENITNLAFCASTKDPMYGRATDSRHLLDELISMGSIESYVACLAVLRESELIADPAMNEYAWISLRMMDRVLIDHPIIKYIYKPLLHYIFTFIGTPNDPPIRELTKEQAQKIDQPDRFVYVNIGGIDVLARTRDDENYFL